MAANGFNQQCEQIACGADPTGERGAVEVDALSAVDLRLPVERKRVGVLGDQHVGQKTGSGKAAIDGPGRRRSLHDPVAGIATQLRPHVPDHLEAGTDVLQHLGDIFAELAQSTAAVGASRMIGQMGVDLARKMLRQRPAEGLRGNRSFCRCNRSLLLDGLGRAELFKL